jgi:hypothetical protein
MALAVSRWPLFAEARGRFWVILVTADKVAVVQVAISSVFAIFCSLKCVSVDLTCTFKSVG